MEQNVSWRERFRDVYKPLLGDKYDEFENALSAPKLRHIRLNSSRNIDYLSEISETSTPQLLNGFDNVYKIIEGGETVTGSIGFQTGGAYIMNPSSVVPAKLLASLMPENPVILDVSAAPGGKTCALSDYTKRKGVIVANELSSSRLKSLHFNLEKYGCYDVKTVSMDGRLLSNVFDNVFDGILLDAPCSNENKIFRDKTVQAQWSKDLVDRMATLQRQLITSAFKCLASGGVLVYSTCTLSIEENEGVIKHLLHTESDAELIDAPGNMGRGFSGISYIDEKVARITPSADSIDGFFVAVIRKKGERVIRELPRRKMTDKQKDFFAAHFTHIPENISITEAEGRGYGETESGFFGNVRFKRRGLNIYKIAGVNYEPTAQSVWEWGANIRDDVKVKISKDEAIAYLKGFDLNSVNLYKGRIVFYNNIPVGTIKYVDGTMKNKLDRYFLYGKNIEW